MFELSLGVVALCVPAAFVAAYIDSVAGGGGLVTLPALLLSGVPPHMAIGTNKTQALCGTAVSLWVFARGRSVLWRLALVGLPFALLGSSAGSSLALSLDNAVLGRVLLFLLPPAMLLCMLPKRERSGETGPLSGLRLWVAAPLASFAVCFYDGFFGPGTGTFLILAIHWLLGRGLLEASGTAKVLNLASNVTAFAVFLWNGQVIWPLALPMVAAAMAGNALGSRMALRVGERAVRLFLTLALALLMATLVFRHLSGAL